MSTRRRLFLGLLILLGLAAVVMGVEFGRGFLVRSPEQALADAAPGSVPLYVNGSLAALFTPADLEPLKKASFLDAEESKTQEGWLLADILRLYLPEQALLSDTRVVVSSSSRGKSVELTWLQISEPENMILFSLSGRGTLKLASRLPGFDIRDTWIQDTDRIEVLEP